MQAFVLCAGRGKRLRPYSDHLPKPLFPILGKPLLAIILDQLVSQGFNRIGLNAWHLKERLLEFVKTYTERVPAIKIELFEEPELLGTCGALRNASEFFSEPTLVINGDILTNFPLRVVYEAFIREATPCLMFLHRYPGLNKVRIENGWIRGFGDDSEEGWAYTGIQVVSPEWIRVLPEDRELVSAYEKLLGRGYGIKALVATGFYWRDIGTPENYLKAQEEILSGKAHVPHAPCEGKISLPA